MEILSCPLGYSNQILEELNWGPIIFRHKSRRVFQTEQAHRHIRITFYPDKGLLTRT